MKLIIIASGSSANAAVIENDDAAVLIDCGVTLKTLKSGLRQAGLGLENLCAVFVTHSHSDHIKGLPVIHRAVDVPFYSGTDVMMCSKFDGQIRTKDFDVQTFECSHDVPCVGYKISCGEKSICIATDTGTVTQSMRSAFYGCENIMLESNHDIDMLKSGFYSASLKSRIISDRGHLSNADCARFVTELAGFGLRRVVLAHLSENNNTPLLARASTEQCLARFAPQNHVSVYPASPGLSLEL